MEFCYICNSTKFVDQHHYDCKEGQVSSEKVPLCRRCHRTYHDFGLGSFSPDTTARAIKVENIKRQIYGRPEITIDDIHHSSYWRKKWGITKKRIKPPSDQLCFPGLEPVVPKVPARVLEGKALASPARRRRYAQRGT